MKLKNYIFVWLEVNFLYVAVTSEFELDKKLGIKAYFEVYHKKSKSLLNKHMKHTFIRYVILFLSLSTFAIQPNYKDRPNIILINIDDMGWKDVGFMGSDYYETPNIDRLSTLGMFFTNGYAGSANCAPSRACLMTGQWPVRHGIYTVGSSERGNPKHRKLIPIKNKITLSEKNNVIPKVLQEHGYYTCHAGKWHLSESPLIQGFDLNIGGSHEGHPKNYYPPYINVDIKGGENEHLTDVIMKNTIRFVDTVSSPFFLYYSPYAVHTPIVPVKGLMKKYTKKPMSQGQNNAAYASMIENLDRNIGLLISRLKEKNMFDNTLFIFTSDNGGSFKITKQRPLRAGKGSYYEGGIREPFFFVYKDKIPSNSKSDLPITHLDIFPTILKYAGIDHSTLLLDGNDLSSILEEKTYELERPLYWHFPIYLEASKGITNHDIRDPLYRTRPGSVVRHGDWKLHYYFEDKEVELFNLKEDISEKNDLSMVENKKKEEMLGYLNNFWKKTNAPIPTRLNPKYRKP